MSSRRSTSIQVLQNAATANGNGVPGEVDANATAPLIEIAETAGGTVTAAIQGSLDGSNWVVAGYQLVENTASPSRAVANISVLANTRRVFQLLDLYPQVRVVLSSIAGGGTVTCRLVFATPA